MAFNFSPSFGFLTITGRRALATTQRSNDFKISVFPRWYKQVSLEWEVPESWGEVLFNVYFSQVQDSGFRKINSMPINDTFFRDTSNLDLSKFKRGYYVIEAILKERGDITVRSVPVTWGMSPDGHISQSRRFVELRSIEIQRREYWLLSRFNGIKSYLFRRMHYGKRCTECWNPVLKVVVKERCETCYGTSFEGGFFNPVPLYLNYDPSQLVEAKTFFGRLEDEQLGAWTISIPRINPGDIIVRTRDWNMYRVDAVNSTELQVLPVRQMLRLSQLSQNEVEHELLTKGVPEFKEEAL